MEDLSRHMKPHFFQPLLPDYLSNFFIPESFLKHLRSEEGENGDEDDQECAILRDKRHEMWYIKLVMSGHNRLRFGQGWENFCKDHDLQVGDFLVFRHEGSLVFHVYIFDPSHASERQLPPPSPPPMTASARTTNGTGLERMMNKESVKANSAANVKFRPKGLPYFHALVKSHWLKSNEMRIPTEFARNNGFANSKCSMTLIDQKGKQWPTRLHRKNFSTYIKEWTVFHRSNGVKVGDVVVFELITSGENPVMQFYGMPRSEDIHPACSIANAKFKPRGYPYYHTDVKSYCATWGGLPITRKFAEENDLANKHCEMIMIDLKGKQWPISVRQRHLNTAYIGKWRPVQLANGLKSGDEIVLELITCDEKPVMKLYKQC